MKGRPDALDIGLKSLLFGLSSAASDIKRNAMIKLKMPIYRHLWPIMTSDISDALFRRVGLRFVIANIIVNEDLLDK